MGIIKATNLSYSYNTDSKEPLFAVDNVNIEINQGDFIGIIGPTGSGKSTFVRHLNGLLKPTSGTILFDGKDMFADKSKLRDIRFKVGLVFQYPEYQLFEETVYKDIAFGPTNMGFGKDEIDRRVRAACEFVGINDKYLEMSPFDLSGGQKRRVAIAGVAAMEPKVLILDEPTAGLDPKGRDKILNRIYKFNVETGTTVILVSHSMEEVAHYATKVMVMCEGAVVMFDETKKIFSSAAKLREMSLNIPQITDVMLKLKDSGLDVPTDIYTVEDAAQCISTALKERGVNSD